MINVENKYFSSREVNVYKKNVWIFCGTYECYNLVRFNEIEKIYNNRPDQKKRIN